MYNIAHPPQHLSNSPRHRTMPFPHSTLTAPPRARKVTPKANLAGNNWCFACSRNFSSPRALAQVRSRFHKFNCHSIFVCSTMHPPHTESGLSSVYSATISSRLLHRLPCMLSPGVIKSTVTKSPLLSINSTLCHKFLLPVVLKARSRRQPSLLHIQLTDVRSMATPTNVTFAIILSRPSTA